MMLPDDTCIAGLNTVADWKAMKGRLDGCNNQAIWTEALEVFFKTRLESRYFRPARAIEGIKQDVGEGFAIVTLHCSLIEFLASTLEGKTYRLVKKGHPPLGEFEYSNSEDMFIRFLESQEPFSTIFSVRGTAKDFYASVRCGLLHEARTKKGWRIWVDLFATLAIKTDVKIIYRNKMQAAFDHFVECYRQQLLVDADLQQAFIRKFDSLCEE